MARPLPEKHARRRRRGTTEPRRKQDPRLPDVGRSSVHRDMLEAAREDLRRYPTVEMVPNNVRTVRSSGNGFEVQTDDEAVTAQRLLFSTGVADIWPDIPGFESLYGTAIFHCSCCDGYDARDEQVLVIGWGEHVAGYALDLLEWGAHVTLVTDGKPFQGDDDASRAPETRRRDPRGPGHGVPDR